MTENIYNDGSQSAFVHKDNLNNKVPRKVSNPINHHKYVDKRYLWNQSIIIEYTPGIILPLVT